MATLPPTKHKDFGERAEMEAVAQAVADETAVPVYLFRWLTNSNWWHLAKAVPANAVEAYIVFPRLHRPSGVAPVLTPGFSAWPNAPKFITYEWIITQAVTAAMWLAVHRADGTVYMSVDPSVLYEVVSEDVLFPHYIPANYWRLHAPPAPVDLYPQGLAPQEVK